MDKKQLSIEYMSIMTESHPGLTFEEYRDCCVFILFYKYCCLRYDDSLDDQYKLKELVRLAVRGKLQIPSFLRFMEAASSFLHLSGCPFKLTELSFGASLYELHSQEKQKSLARFIRKLIKKIDAWDCDDLLYEQYPTLFAELMTGFAGARKETHISEPALSLYRLFFNLDDEEAGKDKTVIFVPEFQYGLLFDAISRKGEETELLGYESCPEYLQVFRILCFMQRNDDNPAGLFQKSDWEKQDIPYGSIDRIAAFMPDGPGGSLLTKDGDTFPFDKDLLSSKSKGELPFVLSALPYLKENGSMAIIFPSALLYREGKETQIRKYLVEELNCLDTVVLLPDSLFVSAGQQEVFLFFRKGRKRRDIMFFDCSDLSRFGQEDLDRLQKGMESRDNQAGYCAGATPESIAANDYNMNLPRYISKTERELTLDLEARRERIKEIDAELKDIDAKITMYRRALEI